MQFFDTIKLGQAVEVTGMREMRNGSVVVHARAARGGNVQDYLGVEVERPDLSIVRVYRDANEIFKKDSLRTFGHKAVTVNHPAKPVTPRTWKDVAAGHVGEEVLRDGEFVKIPMLLADQAAIDAVKGGKRELSVGYSCDLLWEAGVTADGKQYDAKQVNIICDHVAIVDRGRAGPDCRITDSADEGGKTMRILSAGDTRAPGDPSQRTPQPIRDTVPMKMHTVDGHSVELNDAAAIAVAGLRDKLATAVSDALARDTALKTAEGNHAKAIQAKDAEIADAKKAGETKDGEIAALKKQLEDAKLTPQKLDDAVKARVAVMADAEKIAGKGKVTFDGKTEAEIRRDAVAVRLGDVAKALSDEAINGAFLSYASKAPTLDHLGRSISASVPAPGRVIGDASATAYDEMCRGYDDAWKRPTHQTQGNA